MAAAIGWIIIIDEHLEIFFVLSDQLYKLLFDLGFIKPLELLLRNYDLIKSRYGGIFFLLFLLAVDAINEQGSKLFNSRLNRCNEFVELW